MSIAVDAQRVIQYHQSQGHKVLRLPQVAAGTGLSTNRVWATYAHIREVEAVVRHRILVAETTGGHRLIEGSVTDADLRQVVRWARRRQQNAETANRRARKALDAAAVLALTGGSKHTLTIMQLAASAKASEQQGTTAVQAADAALGTI